LQNPHFKGGFFAQVCPVLHRIAFPVVSEWCQTVSGLHALGERLGHATISQTMDTYSHVRPDMQDQAAAALDTALR
jgi:integrase